VLKAILASLLLAQTLIVPLTGARIRDIQAESLFHTLFHDFFPEDDGTTYVQTGDIPAMWLRDASAQSIPYVRFQAQYGLLRTRFAGVIERSARAIDKDVYANAFQADYHVWERKWEVDSVAWPVVLITAYYGATHDASIFTPNLHVAFQQIVHTYDCEERHGTCSPYRYPYHVSTDEGYNWNTGLIWCAFRPSDDPVQYRFNIPQNAIAAVALEDIAQFALRNYHDKALSEHARAIEERVVTGILRYGIFYNEKRHVWMYAYETDGYGNYNLMDDANIPNLTALPVIDWVSDFDPIYLNTRAFTLSMDNPWYFSGRYAQGLGSPHTPYGNVWPLGIIARAITTTDDREIIESLSMLAETDSEDGLIHESFYPDGYWRYTRSEFGWANALYADLIFRTLAGYTALDHVVDAQTIIPFETRSQVPTIVSTLQQLENAGDIVGALGRLLYAGREEAINQLR